MSRSFARKLKEQSFLQRQEEHEHEEANQAAARLAAELGSWTSPRLGTNSLFLQNRDYESESVDWLKRDAPDVPTTPEESPKLPLTKTPKRTKLLDRSETPVMSNASRKKGRDSIMEMEIEPLPIETPGLPVRSPYGDSSYDDDVESLPDSAPMTALAVSRSMPSAASSHNDYRRYHDALSAFIKAKRQISTKVDLMKASTQEQMEIEEYDAAPHNALASISDIVVTSADATLLSDEKRADMIFLRNLAAICYDRAMEQDMSDVIRKEGNLWMLLYHLRGLGVDALVWDDYPTTKSLYREALRVYLETLASDVDSTPLQLIEALQPEKENCPLVLKRRQGILSWLQECFQKVLPSGATRERLTGIVESQLLLREGLPETDKDPELLRLSLALILAGRLDDAIVLVRSSGVPWRAAQWSGGEPHGYAKSTIDANAIPTPVGNARRPLWRHMMRLHSENLNSSPSADKNEAAIAALLSNSLKDALANPSMRSWERGLNAAFYCVLGRMEDEMLHIHNNNRRKLNPPYPGTEFEEKERQHLEATAEIADVDESEIVRILDCTPFDEMRCNDLVTRATASFLVGKNSIISFLKDMGDIDGNTLRFVTHLALFLDSLSMGSSPVYLDGLQLLRCELLVQYLQHLAAREDLWFTLVCYASMLPVEVVADHLPPLLVNIENHEDRKVVVHQLRDFMTKPGIDKELLCKVIDIVFNEEDVVTSTDTPSPLDYRKMKAVLWLCHSDDHAVEAVVSANTLLRQFLLQDKVQSALLFVDDVFPSDIFEKVDFVVSGESGCEGGDVVTVESARSEHQAFKSFLEAIRAYQSWMDIIEMTPTQQFVVDDTVDRNLLNAAEIAVADKVERRMLLEEKRRVGNAVVTVADRAQKALSRVLEHPGGWLVTEDEDFAKEAPEEYNRRRELEELRAKILPHVVKIYISVCLDTSRWISAALDDAVEKLNCTRESAIQQLDDSSIQVDGSSDRSPVDPQYWTKLGLKGARLATSETYGIRSACSSQYKGEILNALGTLVQVDVMYGTPDDSRLIGS